MFKRLSVLVMALTCSIRAQEWPTIELAPPLEGFVAPVHVTHAGDGSSRLFVVQLGGVIIAVGPNGTRSEFLNISQRVGCSQGLLSVAFPPGFATKRYFYVNYTDTTNCDLVISRFSLVPGSSVGDAASEQVLLRIPKPAAYIGPAIFHSGGELAFGPDGYLYLGVGDGDTGRSPGDPEKLAQNLGTLRGKILRLDVESPGSAGYGIPQDNPFVSVPGAGKEIWAVGVRNPWRSSFDRLTGDFYIADVGQDKFEEINFQPAGAPGGANYGWRLMEGTQDYMPETGTDSSQLTLPVHTYIVNRTGDCSITGGRVYRGSGNPRMEGIYFYGDFSSGRIWGLRRQGETWENRLLRDSPAASGPTFIRDALVTFGEDEAGNIYVSDYRAGNIYMLKDAATVGNTAPVASNHFAAGIEDQPIDLNISATDAEGDPLTYSITTAPSHGTLSGSAPNLVYTPATNYNGGDSFTFRASDGFAISNVATVALSVAPVNDAPTANAQAVQCTEDIPRTITLSASDVEGGALTYAVVAGPTHGTLTGPAPNLTYTPALNYNGSDSFTFRANDGTAWSDTAAVSISISAMNDAPIARADSARTTKNTAVTIPVLTNDTDVDGDVLTITNVSAPARGIAAIVGTSVRYTPSKNASGNITFNYTIGDGKGGTATAAVTVTISAK